MVRNKFYEQVYAAEKRGADTDELRSLLGHRRSKLGIFEGDLDEGELEIGQVSAAIEKIEPAERILKEIWDGYLESKKRICNGYS